MELKSDHKIDDSGGNMVSHMTGMGTGSYVTGISNELESSDKEFHLVLFDPSVSKLYYAKVNLDEGEA